MISIEEAFTDAWRSYRIAQGDDPSLLPDPLGAKRQKGRRAGSGQAKKPLQPPIDTGGGFLVDDEDDVDGEGDASEAETTSPQPRFLPVSFIADALVNLHLDATDAFVLGLFNEVAISAKDAEEAQGAIDGSRRRKRGGASERTERMISTADFVRVADVLLDGKAGVETDAETDAVVQPQRPTKQRPTKRKHRKVGAEAEPERASARPRRAAAKYGHGRYSDALEDIGDEELSNDEADAYISDTAQEVQQMDDASSQEEGTDKQRTRKPNTRRVKKITVVRKGEDGDVHGSSPPRKSASGGLRRAARRATTTDDEDIDETDDASHDDDAHMTPQQRRQAHAAFGLLAQRLDRIAGKHDSSFVLHARRISKADAKLLVQSVGEKISDREIEEMIEEGVHFFASASAPNMTREAAKRARDTAAGHATAQGRHDDTVTIGINEFAGILMKGRLI